MEDFGIFTSQTESDEFYSLINPVTAGTFPIPPPMMPNIESSFSAEVHETYQYSEPFFQPHMASNPRSIDYSSAVESQDSTNSLELQTSSSLIDNPETPTAANQLTRSRRRDSTQDDRLKIKTALDLGLSVKEISAALGFSGRQIYHVRMNGLESGKKRSGRRPAISDDKAQELVRWLHSNPNFRHAPFRIIPNLAPELNLNHFGMKAIRTAFKSQGYGRRVSKKKGFSDRLVHRQIRLNFVTRAFLWTQRLSEQMFSDKVWACGGANSRRFVTTLAEGDRQEILFDRFRPECLTPKYGKLPAWMFYGVIHNGRKALGTFWEKEFGTMNSVKYDAYIFSQVQRLAQYERSQRRDTWFQYDDASCHRSGLTRDNLRCCDINTIDWPPYSPDLNLIEHVWAKMKNYIQDHYSLTGYDPRRVGPDELRRIIQEAWDTGPDEFISDLYASWQDRCKAVIDARGGPTKY